VKGWLGFVLLMPMLLVVELFGYLGEIVNRIGGVYCWIIFSTMIEKK
jgi:hypothetical protein